jgi:heat shock protein HslJ
VENLGIQRNTSSKGSGGPALIFGNENVDIITNCNFLSTEYKLNGTSVQFGSAYSTYKYCQDMKMEAYFHSNLKRISSLKYSEGILYLYIGNKMIGSFKRIES